MMNIPFGFARPFLSLVLPAVGLFGSGLTSVRAEVPPYEFVEPPHASLPVTEVFSTFSTDPIQNSLGDLTGLRRDYPGTTPFYLFKASDKTLVDTSGIEQYLAGLGTPANGWTVLALNSLRHVLLAHVEWTGVEFYSRFVIWRPEAATPAQRYTSLPSTALTAASAALDDTDGVVAYMYPTAATSWEYRYSYSSPSRSGWEWLQAPAIDAATPGRPIYGNLTPAGSFVGYTYRGAASTQYPVAWQWSASSSTGGTALFSLPDPTDRSGALATAVNGDSAGYLQQTADAGACRLFWCRGTSVIVSDFTLPTAPDALVMNSRGGVAFQNHVWTVSQESGTWQQALRELQPLVADRVDIRPIGLSDTNVALGTAADARGRFLPCLWKAPESSSGNPWPVSLVRESLPAYQHRIVWPLALSSTGFVSVRWSSLGHDYPAQLRPLPDTDHDGLPDAWEQAMGTTEADYDPDGDQLTNLGEYHAGTRASGDGSGDTDGDGLPDGWEVQKGYDPLDPSDAAWDIDHDGLTTLQEYQAGTLSTSRYEIIELGSTIDPWTPWVPPSPIIAIGLGNSEPLAIAAYAPFSSEDGYLLGLRLEVQGIDDLEILPFHAWPNNWSDEKGANVRAINREGSIVGEFSNSYFMSQAFLLPGGASAETGVVLGPLPTDPRTIYNLPAASWAFGISEPLPGAAQGLVSGALNGPSGTQRGFRWNPATNLVEDVYPSSYPLGCSKFSGASMSPGGIMYGSFADANAPRYDWHVYLFDGSTYTYLTLPWETNSNPSYPPTPLTIQGINLAGDILATLYDRVYSEANERVFLWPAGENYPTFLPVPGGGTSAVTALNDHRQIVGSAMTVSGQSHAFLWERIIAGDSTSWTMLDLNTAIPASAQWELRNAIAINNQGDILCQAYKFDPEHPSGQDMTVLLRPVEQDADHDGLPDDWEKFYFGPAGANPSDLAARGDGHTILQAFQLRLDPNDFYNGHLPGLQLLSGDQQKVAPTIAALSPLTVLVLDPQTGQPIVNAPVSFTGYSGTTGEAVVRTDSSGIARTQFFAPPYDGECATSATVTVGGQTAEVWFNTTSLSPGPPKNFNAKYGSSSSEIVFTWESAGETATGYQIEKRNPDGTWSVVGTVPAGAREFRYQVDGSSPPGGN